MRLSTYVKQQSRLGDGSKGKGIKGLGERKEALALRQCRAMKLLFYLLVSGSALTKLTVTQITHFKNFSVNTDILISNLLFYL